MAYIDVLPLATMKTYLRIDDTQNETDAEITSMINSAFRYIERMTNILVVQQSEKSYPITENCIRIYDHPINDVVKGIDEDGADVTLTFKTNYNKYEKSLYTEYFYIDASVVTLVLDVGYSDPDDVPDDVVQVAKEMVKAMFYEQETEKTFREMLSPMSWHTLESLKRFII